MKFVLKNVGVTGALGVIVSASLVTLGCTKYKDYATIIVLIYYEISVVTGENDVF